MKMSQHREHNKEHFCLVSWKYHFSFRSDGGIQWSKAFSCHAASLLTLILAIASLATEVVTKSLLHNLICCFDYWFQSNFTVSNINFVVNIFICQTVHRLILMLLPFGRYQLYDVMNSLLTTHNCLDIDFIGVLTTSLAFYFPWCAKFRAPSTFSAKNIQEMLNWKSLFFQ